MSALTSQVGGDHYRNKAIQPVQFSMANELDACAHSILKYVTRHREKHGRRDLEKALHFVDLRLELATVEHRVTVWRITMENYCRANQVPQPETYALKLLGVWLQSGDPDYARLLKNAIRRIIAVDYDSTGE